MRLIINASTLSGTGVTQVALSFIRECLLIEEHEYLIFASPCLQPYLEQIKLPKNCTCLNIGGAKLYTLSGRKDIKRMKEAEKSFKPDCVFSIFGPSWWRPTVPHLMGFAYGHYVYKDSPFFKLIPFSMRLNISVMEFIHKKALLHNGSYFVSETVDVSSRLQSFLGIDEKHSFVVSNTASSFFLSCKDLAFDCERNGIFNYYTLCSCARHKNLEILNDVIPILKDRGVQNIRFNTTLREADYNRIFNEDVRNMIVNHGPIRIEACPSFVANMDALFLPTLIECFSASYPEAMVLKKPIVTSNLSFAKAICGNGAIYFDPLNAQDIAEKVIKLAQDSSYYNQKAIESDKKFQDFITPKERALRYLDICKKISKYKL